MMGKTIVVNDINTGGEPYIYKTSIDGVLIVKRPKYDDFRGSFQELFRIPNIEDFSGIDTRVLQGQISVSKPKVLRGIHTEPRDKIITPILGKMVAVIVDLRTESKTFKKWVRIDFNNTSVETSRVTLFVPEGCGNSLCVNGESTDLLGGNLIYHYTYSSVYDPKWAGMGVKFDDKDLDIEWPVKDPIISDRDKNLPSLKEFLRLYRNG